MTKKTSGSTLPPYTFGCEIECMGPTGQHELRSAMRLAGLSAERENDYGYGHYDRGTWVIGTDCSIDTVRSLRGFEIKSPILSGVEGLRAIRKVCRILTAKGFEVNKSCGLHVHVGIKNAAETFRGEEIIAILERYNQHKSRIDLMLAKSRRSGENEFCTDFDEVLENIAESRCSGFEMSLNEIAGYGEHYDAVSVQALQKYGTIEFRQHHGTVNGKKITNWVKFLLNHVEMARKIVKAKAKPLTIPTVRSADGRTLTRMAPAVIRNDTLFAGQPASVRKHFIEQAKRINGEAFSSDALLAR